MSRLTSGWSVARRALPAIGLALALGGCSMFGDKAGAPQPAAPPSDSTFSNLFKYGSPSAPQINEMQIVDMEFECPQVEILDGAASMRVNSNDTIKSQISIGQTARECTVSGNTVTLRVGVEGRALLGTGGQPGTYVAPVRIVVKNGEKVLVSRLQRKSVTIPAGDTQAAFVVIEEGIVVPKGDLTLLVGLDPAGRAEAPARRRKNS
ncbi:MAG: hypothetical protein U1E62_04935 [Alsobacter sp.]